MSDEMTIRIEPTVRGVRKMARAVGVSPGHLSRVLSGDRTPGKRLAAELHRRGWDRREMMEQMIAQMITRMGVVPGSEPVLRVEHGTGTVRKGEACDRNG